MTAHGVLGLEQAASVEFVNIAAARRRTEQGPIERRERFAAMQIDDDATVALTGSWGRREVTESSDNDAIILFSGSSRDAPRPSEAQVAGNLDGSPPGPEEIFGKHV
jgi:UTP:GlnB (protein PII) uridylyltransferase